MSDILRIFIVIACSFVAVPAIMQILVKNLERNLNCKYYKGLLIEYKNTHP